MRINGRPIGSGHPTYLIAELGINHNGSLQTAMKLIQAAADAGADAVKFQVGNPELYVHPDQWGRPRETPWGILPYIDYRKRMELSDEDLEVTKLAAEASGLDWFASPLDVDAVARLEALDAPTYKIASPKLTDAPLRDAINATQKPVILSTGMSTEEEIHDAVAALTGPLAVLHCTSSYPTPEEQVNLAMITTLQRMFPELPVGFSDHTVGVPCSVAAVALGACIIERHLTLSRAMWGSDHAASLEPAGFATMAKYIRTVEAARGDGIKRVYAAERENMRKFRLDATQLSHVG